MNKRFFSIRIISLILSVLMFTSFADCRVFAAAADKFTVKISTDESSTDLSGVKFDIYTSELITGNRNFEKYTNTYSFSAYSDKNGKVSFTRPKGSFIVKADLDTLPRKTAIQEDMWRIDGSSTKSITANIDRIKYININTDGIDSENVKVTILSAAKKEIFCNYTVDISDPETTASVNEKDGRSTYTTTRTITVRANGTIRKKTLTSEKTETAVPVVSLDPQGSEFTRSLCERDGFFKLHFNPKDFSDATVERLYSTFNDALVFFKKYGFNEPIKEEGSDYYNIYLICDGGASATTKHVKKGSSYIIIKPPADYTRVDYPYYTSVVAHELFHAIQYTYTRVYDINPPKWFREAMSNWAGMAYINYATPSHNKYINIFQSNPELPLTSTFDSRVYGSTLFIQTISEYFGGHETIRKIFLQFAKISKTAKNPEMTAISRGLAAADKSYSRSAAFMRFALNNMYPSHYYKLGNSSKWNNAARSGVITSSCTLRRVEIQPLSSKYYDITPQKSAESVYITVFDSSGKYSNLAVCCAVKKANGAFADFTNGVKSFTTYRIKNLSALNVSAATIGLVDTSLSSNRNVSVKIEYK